ncbi:Atm interactor [Plakobranchus ocellatus]|uniref:Atm interactor n=1 Tax=Plakobranchus ocellatus TaxID=259542 RepID=A0AAV4A6E5_9GAST|nr:Atm interactor [Plakobranchus ocellatus]
MANDISEKIERITPSPSELIMCSWQDKLPVRCSEPGCTHVAVNSSVMNLHKAKVHKITSRVKENVKKQFHCPVTSCYFNTDSERFFKNMDILRVHYMKVHSEKKFKCVKCEKAFALARDCQRHEEECGQTFPCPECGKEYTKRDSLLKHCDAKNHTRPVFIPKPKPTKKTKICETKVKKADPKSQNEKRTPAFILPKQLNQVLVPLPVQSQSVELQTDITGAQYLISEPCKPVSQAVQTASGTAKSVSIQTNSGLKLMSGIPNESSSKKMSLGIQTVLFVPPSAPLQSCVAQTQTLESILQPSVMATQNPTVKKNKGFQKDLKKSKKPKNVVKLSSGSQTNHCSTVGKQHLFQNSSQLSASEELLMKSELWNTELISPPNSKCIIKKETQDEHNQMEFDASMDDLFNSMSTQTELSYLLDELLTPSPPLSSALMPQMQNSHTQTSQRDALNLHFFEFEEPGIRTHVSSQTCGPNDHDKCSNIQSCYTQTSLIKDQYFSGIECNKQSKHTQYCFSETDISLQDQTIQTQNSFHDHVMGCQEQTTQTHRNRVQTHLTQIQQTDQYLPVFDDYQEQDCQTQNISLDNHLLRESHSSKLPFAAVDFQEQNTQTHSLSSQNSFTQTFMEFSNENDDQYHMTQTSIKRDVEDASTFLQSSGFLKNEADDMHDPGLVILPHDKSQAQSKELLDTKSPESFNGMLSDAFYTLDSNFLSQHQLECDRNSVMLPHSTCENENTWHAYKQPIACTSTQTKSDSCEIVSTAPLNNYGWEIGTQTANDLEWDMGTQTINDTPWGTDSKVIEDLVLDMGTQTITDMSLELMSESEDELSLEMGTQTLEDFITDSHTQTDESRHWYDDVVTQTGDDFLDFLTKETETQTESSAIFKSSGHQRAAQTEEDWLGYLTKETETQTMESFNFFSSQNQMEVQTGDDFLEFLTKETETQTVEAFNNLSTQQQREVQTGVDLLELFSRETQTQTHPNVFLQDLEGDIPRPALFSETGIQSKSLLPTSSSLDNSLSTALGALLGKSTAVWKSTEISEKQSYSDPFIAGL